MSKFFTQDDCLEVVRNKVKSDNFDLVEYELEDLPQHGEVFNEKTRKLRVKIKEPGKSGWTLLKFFLKELPSEENTQSMMGQMTKEGEIYRDLLPKLKKYIGGKLFPECYLTKNNQLVVLEDLTLLGYKSLNDYKVYDEDHIELVLQGIAKYHAASYIHERNEKVPLSEIMPNHGREIMFVEEQNNPLFEFLCSSISAIESVVDVYYSHFPKEITSRMSKIMMGVPERLNMINRDCKFKVFSHADLWNNNLMFRYDAEGRVESLMIFDFQLCKYTHPAYDVLQAITLLTSSTDRDSQYEELLIYYYNHLSRELAQQDVSVHSIMTWAQLKESADSLRPVMLAIAPICLHFMLIPRDLVKACVTNAKAREFLLKHDRSDVVLEAMRVNENYRKRVQHSVHDLLEYIKHH